MLQLETISTDCVPQARRLEFWNSAASETLTAESAVPLSPRSFSGRLRRTDLGNLRVAEFTSDAATVTHSKAHIASSREAVFLLRMQLQGTSITHQNDRQVRLQPGDFTLCDSMRPYRISFEERASLLTLRVPRETLLRYIACPEAVVLHPMSGSSGPSSLTSRCLQEFWHFSSESLTASLATRFAHIILELVASSYAELPDAKSDRASLGTALRIQVLDYIEAHLSEFELTPSRVARAFRITPRYLHLLFAAQDETVGRYILRRRLEKCSRALADPLLQGRSIYSIAYDHGFKSLPHFCKVFRDRYAVAPGDFRRLR